MFTEAFKLQTGTPTSWGKYRHGEVIGISNHERARLRAGAVGVMKKRPWQQGSPWRLVISGRRGFYDTYAAPKEVISILNEGRIQELPSALAQWAREQADKGKMSRLIKAAL